MIALVSMYDTELLLNFRILATVGKVKAGSSPGHRDGWGIGWYDSQGYAKTCKSEKDATSDPAFEETVKKLSNIDPQITIGHLRKASDKATIAAENAHPFQLGNWLFAHNGGIHGFRSSHEIDSHYIFRELTKSATWLNQDLLYEAIRKTKDQIQKNFKGYSSLTFLLSDDKNLYAYRDFNRGAPADYYTLFYAQYKGGWIIVSEYDKLGLSKLKWKPIRNEELRVFSVNKVK